MSSTTELSPFNERDFRAIEAAVLETEKGRWFLNEFGRRNRVADTQTLLSALSRLEHNLTSQNTPVLEEHANIAALSNAIEATRSDIGAIRNDMLKDCAEIPPGKAVFSHLSENAHQISVDLIATAEALQGTVNTLRKGADGASHADTIDGHVHNLFDRGWRQDVLAQRISKAMGLLEHLEQSLKARGGAPATSDSPVFAEEVTRSLPSALTPENLKFFDGDNDMFSTADKASDDAHPSPDLQILKDDPVKTGPEEPVGKPAIDDETPQNIAKAVVEPGPGAAVEPAAQDASQNDAETEQASLAKIDEKPIEPNIVVIRRGKSSDATDDSDQAAADDSSKAAADDGNEAAADDSNQAAADDGNQATVDNGGQAATDDSDHVTAKPDDTDTGVDVAKAESIAELSRINSLLLKKKPEEDVWAKVTATASELSAGAASSPTAKAESADTPQKANADEPEATSKAAIEKTEAEPADAPQKTSADEPVTAQKAPSEEAETRQEPVAKDDQPSVGDAKQALTDMDLEAPDTPATSTAHSADDALSAFADIAGSPATEDAQAQAEAASETTSDDATTDESVDDDAPDDKERIVVIRRSTSEEAEIPFADYLGVEPPPEPQTKTGSAS